MKRGLVLLALVTVFYFNSEALTFNSLNLAVKSKEPSPKLEFDQYGGCLNIQGKTTGWFHLEIINDRYWLVTPEGHGFISFGVNHLSRMSPSGKAITSEVIESIHANLKRGGYNTWGYDSPPPTDSITPFIGSLTLTRTGHYLTGKDFWYDDVFDSKFQETTREKIRAYCGRMAKRKNMIGYYWTDTPEWDIENARKMHGTDWVSSLRNHGAYSPGKLRYINFLKKTYKEDITQLNQAYGLKALSFDWLISHDFNQLNLARAEVRRDDELFLQLIAREFYQVTGKAFREFDPNHLMFGERYKMHLHPDVVLKEAMPYMDVLSIQPGPESGPAHGPGKHETEFDGALFDRLHQLTGKPIIICDHALSFYTPEYPKTLWNQYPTQQAAANGCEIFINAAMSKPYMIGFQRCQYIGVLRTEAGYFKQGLLRPDGTPYAEFLDAIGKTNREILDSFYRKQKSTMPRIKNQ